MKNDVKIDFRKFDVLTKVKRNSTNWKQCCSCPMIKKKPKTAFF